MNSLKDILQLLKSDKIKERQEGVSSLRTVFSRDSAVSDLDEPGNGKAWLVVFQSLFTCVLKEKGVYAKQLTSKLTSTKVTESAAFRRFADAAAAVRWLTERSVQRLNKKVIDALLNHLLQTMISQDQLLAPVALDYIKAIKCVITFTVHMDHIDKQKWIRIVEICFNVILGDPLGRKLEEDGNALQDAISDMDSADSDMYQDEEDSMDYERSVHNTSTLKRRHHSHPGAVSRATPQPSTSRANMKSISNFLVPPEQIELISVLAIILRSPSAPVLSSKRLTSAIFDRLSSFLQFYHKDSSLYHDYLLILSATLSHTLLNCKHDVQSFARSSWDALVGLWGTKNRRMKEYLVGILRVLFPFLTTSTDPSVADADWSWAEGVRKLWQLLDGEAERTQKRWGADGLSFESLRLEILLDEDDADHKIAFVAGTFRSGWHFDAGQALAWTILELRADCAEKLYFHSESTLTSTVQGGKKRQKVESPITSLLSSIRLHENTREDHLQTLLFIIDRHWNVLHESLHLEVLEILKQLVHSEDGLVQSWVFLCFTAITRAAKAAPEWSNHAQLTSTWDQIWAYAIRRVNVPIVSRAAAHAARALLSLSSTRTVTLDIEAIIKDLDVQGPAFPHDSVCSFLTQCLFTASQDARLYRMHLEEKVLLWLMDTWGRGRIEGEYARMPLYVVGDILLLLETICGLSKRSHLGTRILLPDCPIVEVTVDERKTRVIRDFLLEARLPAFKASSKKLQVFLDAAMEVGGPPSHAYASGTRLLDLAEPRGRERRVSSFMLKLIETLLTEWDHASMKESGASHMSAERARKSLDIAIIALSFEGLLVLNGTRLDRRSVQAACKLVALIIPLLLDKQWSVAEKALVLFGLWPLVSSEGDEREGGSDWEAMLPPDQGTGIRTETLRKLATEKGSLEHRLRASRRNLQRIIWQSADVQDAFAPLMNSLRDILGVVAGKIPKNSLVPFKMDIDDRDGFGPIHTNQAIFPSSTDASQQSNDAVASRSIAEVCISFLAVAPTLQSSSGEPTHDRELAEFVEECPGAKFLLIAPAYFHQVRERALHLNRHTFRKFLDKIGGLLEKYAYSKSEEMSLLVMRFLDATMHLWLRKSSDGTNEAVKEYEDYDVGDVQELCRWISTRLRGKGFKSWRVRDSIIEFLERYLTNDPEQCFWVGKDQQGNNNDRSQVEEDAALPAALLCLAGGDEDIRVRFRAATANAHFFSLTRTLGIDAMHMYAQVIGFLSLDLSDYERMLTRILSLGNIMVVSSAVRRGPYWHLLEICLHGPGKVYAQHIESTLRGVSDRMGLVRFADLFEAYASQIAYSIRQNSLDFLLFPPRLLGYQDRREYAQVTLRAFTPANVLASGSPEAIGHGQKLFANHCKAIQKTTAEGIQLCFGDIIGHQIMLWIDLNMDNTEVDFNQLEILLRKKAEGLEDDDSFARCLKQNADTIVAAILRTLKDDDISGNGVIVTALSTIMSGSEKTATTFQAITRYRYLDNFYAHQPNLPCFGVETVLKALHWFDARIADANALATTYHVLHQLFADVHSSPIVNEQLRLINAISLWVAFHNDKFEESMLLHTLIHGATSLLGQVDLARAAQSILEWAFHVHRRSKQKDLRLADILIRICCFAHDYAADDEDTQIASLGNALLQWIDAQAFKLSNAEHSRGQVFKALAAWPHQPSPALASLYEDLASDSLSSAISDHRISSNKFRLVKRLRDMALSKEYARDKFASTDFWRLKECIPLAEYLQSDDIDAFSALLIIHSGQIHGFGSEQSSPISIRSRHHSGASVTQDSSEAFPERVIVLSLLMMLDGNDASKVHVAYLTLRHIMSVLSSRPRIQSWSSEYKQELDYLEEYQLIPNIRPKCDLQLSLSSESYLEAARDFPRWIAMLTVLLCDFLASADAFYGQLMPSLESDVEFAEQVLPILIHTVLYNDLISNQENFNSHRRLLSEYFTSILSSDFVSVSCLRSIIDTVLHLRNFRPPNSPDALAYDKWLEIDFTLLSRNAITCGAYTTALLFLELAEEYRGDSVENATTVEQVLFDIYSHIDEPDGFYGIKTTDLRQFLIRRFHHEKQWDKAFRFHGAALEAVATDSTEADGLLQSFHSFGFHRLAMETLQSSSTVAGTDLSSSSTMNYQLGWRTETWDLPDKREEAPGASLYHALRAIHRERDPSAIDTSIRTAKYEEISRLRELGPENLTEIREVIRNLMCLYQVTQWRGNRTQDQLKNKHMDVKEWSDFVDIDADFEFTDLESIMATRISLVKSIRLKEERGQIGTLVTPFAHGLAEVEKACLVRLSEAARDSRQMQIALNSIVRAQRLEREVSFDVSQEFANVLWLQKEEKLAVQHLKSLVNDQEVFQFGVQEINPKARMALMLARLGTWTSEACLEKPTDILSHFFDPATSILNEIGSDDPNYAAIYHQCAMFASQQFQAILKSPDAIRWKVYVDRKTQEIKHRNERILSTQSGTREHIGLTQDQRIAIAQLNEDTEAHRRYSGARDAFLAQALDMYSRCLESSDAFDDDGPIRLCSLWFSNFENQDIQDRVHTALNRVPSRKFTFLAHQLSARLSNLPSSSRDPLVKSQENLQALILRMCQEHPFHSLYQVYCLRSEQPLLDNSKETRRQSSRTGLISTSQAERAAAATVILDRLRNDQVHGQRVFDMGIVCDASLEWARFRIKYNKQFEKKKGGYFQVPENLLIRKLHVKVPVITARTPLDPSMLYEDCPWIDHYDVNFETAGGVNLPKINVCYSTNGTKYKQLFKGEGGDDLRQDAVMEQVFGLVNVVLRRDRETKRRNLSIRDYLVIPLASQAGVMEFVGNTEPLQRWLQTAHHRYRPSDLPSKEVINQLDRERKECRTQKISDAEPLTQLYLKLKKRFKPVMRHYFTNKHKTPVMWFAMRLNYIRSVATTSIVGHILGLGDRHVSNILIDSGTGEVVHIDLGIAFDQGKLLPVPERVPFRMTADMVDGMGMSGTQGVFQRCAEETLRVLRDGSGIIMTVLEVFKYDPLHSWTASEVKLKRVQGASGSNQTTHDDLRFRTGIGIDMTSGTAEEAADRALASVSRKLDKSLSVEYMINELIAEATDPTNLATIYIGWSPYF